MRRSGFKNNCRASDEVLVRGLVCACARENKGHVNWSTWRMRGFDIVLYYVVDILDFSLVTVRIGDCIGSLHLDIEMICSSSCVHAMCSCVNYLLLLILLSLSFVSFSVFLYATNSVPLSSLSLHPFFPFPSLCSYSLLLISSFFSFISYSLFIYELLLILILSFKKIKHA